MPHHRTQSALERRERIKRRKELTVIQNLPLIILMKTNTSWSQPQTFSVFLALLLVPHCLLADREVRKPTKGDLIGSWIGVSDEGVDMLKLDIAEGGGGKLIKTIFTEANSAVQTAQIESWSLNGREVVLKLRRENEFDKMIKTLSIRFDAVFNLRLIMKGNDWSHEWTLYSETRMKRVRERINREVDRNK